MQFKGSDIILSFRETKEEDTDREKEILPRRDYAEKKNEKILPVDSMLVEFLQTITEKEGLRQLNEGFILDSLCLSHCSFFHCM